ncbi:DNA methylase [bacterium]|nr:DNA methylase [bacterium]
MTNLFDQFEDNEDKKVVCLGMGFDSEEKRRDYFRKELRKKLPELKKMDGFPIGEDDDIIELSDPPYYTACPNPWLNDFIVEWEKEKKELEKQEKRKKDFEVNEPYANDISEGKNNPIYNAHSYHTKVPHPAIMRYILQYTQPGDIVFDGFAGTGMTGVASAVLSNTSSKDKYKIETEFKNEGRSIPIFGERKSICSDLNPLAYFIGYNFLSKIDEIDFKNYVNRIIKDINIEFGWMYQTYNKNGVLVPVDFYVWSDVFTCINCSREYDYYNAVFNEKENLLAENLKCPICGFNQKKDKKNKVYETYYDKLTNKSLKRSKRKIVLICYRKNGEKIFKKPDSFDLEILKKIEKVNFKYKIPTYDLPVGDKTKERLNDNCTHVHHFFTDRNLHLISAFRDLINSSEFRNGMQTFSLITSVLRSCSKLEIYRPEKRVAAKGTFNHLYFPSISYEANVIKEILNKLKAVLKAKTEIEIKGESVYSISSALDLRNISENSVDYIFIDPPFGSNIMYSELDFFKNAWLGINENIKTEAIINVSQNKKIGDYYYLMSQSFIEFFRILKPGKWMTVEFSNTSAIVWNSIQTSIQKSGFIVANVSALDKKSGSYNANTSKTAVKQDLIISCYKPTVEFDQNFKQHHQFTKGLWDFIEEHLNHLPIHLVDGKATTAIVERSPKILFDRLISFYVTRNLPVPIDAIDFQRGLRERFEERDGMFFTHVQIMMYDEKKKQYPEYLQASIFVSSEQDGIYWLKRRLEKEKMTYQDIQPDWMQSLAAVRKGDSIPELKIILEENFLKDEAGRWYYPDQENLVDLEKLRHKRLMKEFNLYLETVNKLKAKIIKEVRVEALRAGFKECYQQKDFKAIVKVAEKIPQNLLMEDEFLLQFYDIAMMKI